eukprot:GILI01016969.1.p1 GENE.GILI01016969.1~~GILI01016969.1.p1  ORF type:complete len:682 (-),score=152.58 GILI01016969.1:294-2339(-)
MACEVTFRVSSSDSLPSGSLFVTGSDKAFGSWSIANAAPLKLHEQSGVWSASFSLPQGASIEYKYICRLSPTSSLATKLSQLSLEEQGTELGLAVSWASRPSLLYETFVNNRSLSVPQADSFAVQDQFGASDSLRGSFRHKSPLSRDWCAQEVQVHLNLLTHAVTLDAYTGCSVASSASLNSETPHQLPSTPVCGLHIPDYLRARHPSMTLRMYSFVPGEAGQGRRETGVATVAVPGEVESLPYRDFVFHAPSLTELELHIDLLEEKDGVSTLLARGTVSGFSLRSLQGSFSTALLSPGQDPSKLGHVDFDFFVVTPLVHPLNHPGLVTPIPHTWRSTRLCDVGHRGLGSTFRSALRRRVPITENTIPSFATAHKHGAEMVEFDVQITRDGVPIVFHDFYACLNPQERVSARRNMISVFDLTLEQFMQLHPPGKAILMEDPSSSAPLAGSSRHRSRSVERRKEGVMCEQVSREHPYFIHCEWATLEEMFTLLPPALGFDIELKYAPSCNLPRNHYLVPERNLFLDSILRVVLEHAGSRPIFFSSFDPALCQLALAKCPRFPVFFLTSAGKERYFSTDPLDIDNNDPRCCLFPSSCLFAAQAGLKGVIGDAAMLLKDPELVSEAKAMGLTVMTYGASNEDITKIMKQKECGIDFVIGDKVHLTHRNGLQGDHSAFFSTLNKE